MITQLIPKGCNRRPEIPMTPKYITIHSTGNPLSTAKNEADNVTRNNLGLKVSFHFVVDAKDAYQVLPTNEIGWHAGDGMGSGNRESIGIEICESGDRLNALINASILVKSLLKQFGNLEIVQHNYWSGKNCPRILRDTAFIKGEMDWDWFLRKVYEKEVAKVIYKTYKDIPVYAAPTIKKLMDKKVITGDAQGNINLSEDMVRIFVVHDRLGIYG